LQSIQFTIKNKKMSGSNTEDLLAGRIGLESLGMIGPIDIDEVAQTLPLLEVPQRSSYALVVIEAQHLARADRGICCRWAEHENSVASISDTEGFPIGHLGMIELKGYRAIKNFSIKMISTVTSGLPKMTIGFYA
jgi:hypothetical protein